jgi:hypothetical protein
MKPIIVNGNIDPKTKDDMADLLRDFKNDNKGKKIKIAGPFIETALSIANYENVEIELSENYKEIRLNITNKDAEVSA